MIDTTPKPDDKQQIRFSEEPDLNKSPYKIPITQSSEKPHGAAPERTEKEEENMNNPLGFLRNLDYISEKLNAHKEVIEPYGSKVPTPVMKDLYKQCGNNDLSSAKEAYLVVKNDDVITSDFIEQKNPL